MCEVMFRTECFRPLIKTEYDLTIFMEILNKAKKKKVLEDVENF